MRSTLFFFFTAASVLNIQAQVDNPKTNGPESGNVSYGVIPSIGDLELTNYKAGFNMGKRFEKDMIGVRFGYEYNQFNEIEPILNFSSFEKMHNIRMSVFYRRQLSNSWALQLGLSPSISSNLSSGISHEDFLWMGNATVSKRWGSSDKNSVLTFGAGYTALFGEPRLIPLIGFKRQVNEHFSYSIGLPRTGVYYTIDERNKIAFTVSPEGMYSNNSDEVFFTTTNSLKSNTKLQYRAFKGGFEYTYMIQPGISIFANVGYIPWQDMKIVDSENETLYEFDTSSSVYIATGLKFNINKKRDEKSNSN